jgi:catechol 2,3-dioxygenase-like lactoylglutathione lyase family enzyme
MTTSTSNTSASTADAARARAARLGRLAGVTVGVPDPQATAAFLAEGLGFATRAGDDGRVLVACEGDYGDRGQDAITLERADRTAMIELAFEVADDYDFDALAERLRAAGIEARDRPGGGLSFADAGGNPLACVPASGRADRKPPHDPLRPRRLGHANLKVPHPPAAAAFYADVLGMRLSEQIGEGLYFLRIATEHHNIGLRGGDRAELHHLGFEVAGWNVYQPILDRLAELGHTVEYGPGRHRPGNNIFTYLCDPSSGLRLELFADMAHIPDETVHVPARWQAGDRMTRTINRWGPTPPQSFLD